MKPFSNTRLRAGSKPSPIRLAISPQELLHLFDVEPVFHPGLTGLGGDLTIRHRRLDPALRSISFISCEVDTEPGAFTEMSTCPKAGQGHRGLSAATNEVSTDGSLWVHDAEYSPADTDAHEAIGHVSAENHLPQTFECVITLSSKDAFFKDESFEVKFA